MNNLMLVHELYALTNLQDNTGNNFLRQNFIFS